MNADTGVATDAARAFAVEKDLLDHGNAFR